jgi:RimJ/RimL family protein N-acetyltransferase
VSTAEPHAVPEPPRIDSPRLTIRALRSGDEARLAAVFGAAPEWLALLGRPDPAEAAAQEIAGGAANPGREIALLTDRASDEDVGAIGWWMHRPEPGTALVGTVVVVPSRRGQGLVREAFGALEAWLGEMGVRELRTAFPRRVLPLHRLAAAFGFREMSIAEHQKLGLAGAGTSLWRKPLGEA